MPLPPSPSPLPPPAALVLAPFETLPVSCISVAGYSSREPPSGPRRVCVPPRRPTPLSHPQASLDVEYIMAIVSARSRAVCNRVP